MTMFGDGLDKAVQKTFTRPAPKTAPAQMRYLVKQLGATKVVAQMLRISQRTVERYVKDQIKKPRKKPLSYRSWNVQVEQGSWSGDLPVVRA